MALPRSSSDNFNQQHYNGAGNNVANIKNPRVRKVVLENRQTVAANDAMRSANDEQHQSANPTIDEKFNAGYQKQGLQPQGFRKVKKTEARQTPQKTSPHRVSKNLTHKKLHAQKSSESARASKKIARAKVSGINMVMSTVAICLWPVQLFFAILSIVALGLAGIISAIHEKAVELAESNVAFEALAWVAGKISDGVEEVSGWVDGLVGIDIFNMIKNIVDIFNPANLLIVMILTLMFMALIQVLIYSLLYIKNDIKPFLGKGAGLKIGAVILVFIGYFLPLLNLFPWINVWLLTVWLNPK